MNPWYKRIAIVASAAFAIVLFSTTAASAQPVTPNSGEGWISMTQRTCGSSASWQEQARRNGVTDSPFWAYLGKTYDIQCGSVPQQPAAQPAAAAQPAQQTAAWVNPLPGTCRPGSGGGQFGAPRSGYSHQGIDLGGIEGLRVGTPVHAAHSGTVVSRGYFGNAGNQLQIRDGGTLVKYNHLNGFAVSNGQWVNAGDVIGYMGQTGNATGPHLHLEVWQDGSLKNPSNILPVHC